MTGTPTQLTRESPISIIFDQVLLATSLRASKMYDKSKFAKQEGSKEDYIASSREHTSHQLASFAEQYPTLGDLADDRYLALRNVPAGVGVFKEALKADGIIRPLTAESSLKEAAISFEENFEENPKDVGDPAKKLHTQAANSLLASNAPYMEITVKNLKGVPYKNIGEIVADGKNGKLALQATLKLGAKSCDVFIDYLISKGIGEAPSKGIV